MICVVGAYPCPSILKGVDALLIPATAIPTAEIDADVETYTERNLTYWHRRTPDLSWIVSS